MGLEEAKQLIGAVKYDIVHYTRGSGLDIGRGPHKAYRHFLAMREEGDELMPANVRAELTAPSFAAGMKDIKDASLDFVFSHGVEIPDALRAEISRALKVGGHWVRADVIDGAPNLCVLELIEVDGERLFEPVPTGLQPASDTKTACVVRYGGIGDVLQAACLLPELKRQGYHVTFMCEPLGEQLLRNDPHIDRFLVQDKDQVFNPELVQYFRHWQGKFDRWINLCESIEGTLIALPFRVNYHWPQKLRHEMCNRNYLKFICQLADVPLSVEHHFYPTDDENRRAEERIAAIGGQTNPGWVIGQKWVRPFVILWALSGSGVHKFWPHQDSLIAKILLEIPSAHIITTGDNAAKILEVGWENEPRVHCLSGELGIRDTLTLANHCDMVIGPETGVLNSVAFESMPKILFLSHSSVENLSKHWVNTESLSPHNTACYPCHQQHDNHDYCPQDKTTGASICQVDISPADAWRAVQRAYVASSTVRKILEPA